MACKLCGSPTRESYFSLCVRCWIAKQPASTHERNRLITEIGQLKHEIDHLKTLMQPDFIRKLKQLCHPDRHGNSPLATEVFKEINNL